MTSATNWVLQLKVPEFAAAVELARRPDLRRRPFWVRGHGAKGAVVAAASVAARRRGVVAGTPEALARRRLPEALVLEGDPEALLSTGAALQEVLSGGNRPMVPRGREGALLQLGVLSLPLQALSLAGELQRTVREKLGLPLVSGTGTSPLVAGLALLGAPENGCLLVQAGGERAFVQGLPLALLPGVDRALLQQLRLLGVASVADLEPLSRQVLEEAFGERGSWLFSFARGRDPRPWPEGERGLELSTALTPPEQERGVLLGMAAHLMERCMKRALARREAPGALELQLTFMDGVVTARSARWRGVVRHEANLMPHLERLLTALLVRRLAVSGVRVRLLGLRAVEEERQQTLVAEVEVAEQRRERLADTVAALRARHGFGAVLSGPALDLLGRVPLDEDGFRRRLEG